MIAAFTRALRDPFVHARNAALMALSATADVFDESDCASRLVPAIGPSLVDKEKYVFRAHSHSTYEKTSSYYSYRVVRTQASKTLETYLQRIKTLTANYPDTVIQPPSNSSETTAAPRMATLNTDDSSWAGWAISSFTKKLNTASGDIERVPTPNANNSGDAKLAPPPGPNALAQPRVASASTFNQQPVTSFLPKSSPKGDDDNEDNDPDAWGDLDEENFFDAPVEPARPKTLIPTITNTGKTTWDYDDTASDMSAMLNKSKSPLPKGLTKKSSISTTTKTTQRTGAGSIPPNGRGNVAAARQPVRVASAFRPAVAAKKIEPKKVEDPWGNGDEEDWGDAWDK